MKIFQRISLALTLCILLTGLVAHAVSASPLCICMEISADWRSEANAEESCLVCQLQNGVAFFTPHFLYPDSVSSRIHYPVLLSRLERASEILRPPIF